MERVTVSLDNRAMQPQVWHHVPKSDIQEHVPSTNCWCQPTLKEKDRETGDETWEHNCAEENPQ